MGVPGSQTVIQRSRLHEDRWSRHGDQTGIRRQSGVLSARELRQFELFRDLKDSFLQDISPDISVADWEADATLFSAGSYVDVAFWILEGEVELALPETLEEAALPIFSGDRTREPEPVEDETVARRATKVEDGKIAMLATMDFDLRRGQTMRLGQGEIFGEIGAMNGWPQSVTAQTVTPCTLVQIRLPALRKLRRKVKGLKERLDERYRSRTLRHHLASTPLLRGCPSEVVERLAERVELVSADPDEVLALESDVAEHLFLVRSGFIKLSQRVGAGDVVVSYLSKGATFGDVELLVDGVDTWQATATSVGYSELVRIPRDEFRTVIGQNPELERRLWNAAVERIKANGHTRAHLERSDLIEFGLAKGLVQGASVLVIDLETCTRCDDCVRGCASTHGGIPRFVREGERYDGFLVTRSCYHCEDPVCLVGCPTGAIHRTNIGAVVDIDPSICIGCSTCAQNCPYDNIVMQDLGEVWPDDAVPKRLRGEERFVASKCDLCHTDPAGPACVSSCPHGCATRISSMDEFDALIAARELARG